MHVSLRYNQKPAVSQCRVPPSIITHKAGRRRNRSALSSRRRREHPSIYIIYREKREERDERREDKLGKRLTGFEGGGGVSPRASPRK